VLRFARGGDEFLNPELLPALPDVPLTPFPFAMLPILLFFTAMLATDDACIGRTRLVGRFWKCDFIVL
jgi:hypothetical protein